MTRPRRCGADRICMCAFALEPKKTASAPTGINATSTAGRAGRFAETINEVPSNAAAATTGAAAVERVVREQREVGREVVDEGADHRDQHDRRADLHQRPRVYESVAHTRGGLRVRR